MRDNLIKIGLYGTPGAGKSTTLQVMRELCSGQGIHVARIKLADPLYEAQAAIYKIAGQVLNDFYDQDGELLNFLGHHLRKLIHGSCSIGSLCGLRSRARGSGPNRPDPT